MIKLLYIFVYICMHRENLILQIGHKPNTFLQNHIFFLTLFLALRVQCNLIDCNMFSCISDVIFVVFHIVALLYVCISFLQLHIQDVNVKKFCDNMWKLNCLAVPILINTTLIQQLKIYFVQFHCSIFSSPEHNILKVNFCDCPVSFVCCLSSAFCLKKKKKTLLAAMATRKKKIEKNRLF